MTIVYHRSDLDGLCSAAILYRIYPDAKFVGLDYHDTLPSFDPAVRLIVCDFTIGNIGVMSYIMKHPESVWIDHHWTAISEYYSLGADFPVFLGDKENTQSACELVWEWAHGKEGMPEAVRLLSLFDTWHHEGNQRILTFQAGARAALTSYDDKLWNDLLGNDTRRAELVIANLCTEGALIQKQMNEAAERRMKEYAFETSFLSYRCICVNTDAKGSLQFGDLMSQYAMCITFIRTSAHSWKVGLYSSRPDIHVGNICKQYGGGGHAGAAGFTCDNLPFII